MDQDEVYAVNSYSNGRRYFGDVDGECRTYINTGLLSNIIS